MEETNTAQAGTNEAQSTESTEVKTFTQEEVNGFFNKRYGELMSKVNEYEEKAKKFDEAEERASKFEEKASKLEEEMAGYKQAEELRQIKASVSEKTGIPERLLVGETEEACEEWAKIMDEYIAYRIEKAINNGYPMPRDAGEIHPATRKQSTDEQFADWMKKAMK